VNKKHYLFLFIHYSNDKKLSPDSEIVNRVAPFIEKEESSAGEK
jgi:hypothetical protein